MARGITSKVTKEVEEVEEVPVKGVLMGMNALGYTFIITAIAAAIAWIVFVAYAAGNHVLGDEVNPSPDSEKSKKQGKGATNLETADVCFQAVVASVLLYFVARHHFSNTHL